MTEVRHELHLPHHPHPNHHFHISPQWKGFLEGGVASITAGVATHPMDLIKVRMQLSGEAATSASATSAVKAAAAAAVPRRMTSMEVVGDIVKSQGAKGLFSGVSATVLRQMLYSSTRMGVYDYLKHKMEEQPHPGTGGLPVHKKIAAGLVSGAVGAALGNPADLAMVRMQADGRLPPELRRNYKGVGDALIRTVREEGPTALWRGCGPTIYRAMAVTAGQLATYDQTKEALVQAKILKEGLLAHVAAAFTAAIFASLASNPFDVVKTRLMNMKPDPVTGLPPYSGPLDCALKTMRAEGPLALYKGLGPTIARQGPFALILFITLEKIRVLFKDY